MNNNHQVSADEMRNMINYLYTKRNGEMKLGQVISIGTHMSNDYNYDLIVMLDVILTNGARDKIPVFILENRRNKEQIITRYRQGKWVNQIRNIYQREMNARETQRQCKLGEKLMAFLPIQDERIWRED